MAQTLEIPRDDWAAYFAALERKFLDQPVHIAVENRELGDQEMARTLPLRDLTFARKGSAAGDVELTVGSDRGELGHRIEHVSRVLVEENDNGEVAGLLIEEQGGGRTRIFFEQPSSLRGEARP